MKMYVSEEQTCAVESYTVGDANVADKTAWTCGTDGLHHRFLCSDTLEYGISTDAIRQLFDSRNAVITAFGYDVSRSKLPRELLPACPRGR